MVDMPADDKAKLAKVLRDCLDKGLTEEDIINNLLTEINENCLPENVFDYALLEDWAAETLN